MNFTGRYFNFSFILFLSAFFLFQNCKKDSKTTPLKITDDVILNLETRIQWTEYGVPHITAPDYKSLGLGLGYAFAKENICVLADQIVKVRSERARYHGPGHENAHVVSDFTHKILKTYEKAEDLFSEVSFDAQNLMEGYALGYNHFLNESSEEEIPAACRGKAWLREITKYDVFAYGMSLTLISSGEILAPMAMLATPPEPEPQADLLSTEDKDFLENLQNSLQKSLKKNHQELPSRAEFKEGLGSNAWALGAERTENQRGMLLANPHFPHTGALRFFESHLKIPGSLDVAGASLYGTPVIQIGFNKNVAWSHTVSTSLHFTLYKLSLSNQNPRRYEYDRGSREISEETFSIDVLGPEGNLVPMRQTIYRSHYGPIIANDLLPWTNKHVYTFKDANADNIDFVDHWLAIGRSENVREIQGTFRRYRGIPWVNTLASDRAGDTLFIEGTPVPRLSDRALRALNLNAELLLFYSQTGLPLLNGSNSVYEWVPGVKNGITSIEEAPQIIRRDYVANHNDSHWLINSNERLEGYSFLYGAENEAQSLRTRMGLTQVDQDAERFDMDSLKASFFSNRVYMGELFKEDLIERCRTRNIVPIVIQSVNPVTQAEEERTVDVDIRSACAGLSQWDSRANFNSRGVQVMREFSSFFDHDNFFAQSFSSNDPVNTPSGLKNFEEDEEDLVLDAFARAAYSLQQANIDPSAPLRAIQFQHKGDERIPLHGSTGRTGGFNVYSYKHGSRNRTLIREIPPRETVNKKTGLGTDGYVVDHGSSFVYVIKFTEDGFEAESLMTYSQSGNPDSVHYSDQSELYNSKRFKAVRFHENEITADPQLRTKVIRMNLGEE